MEQQVMIWQPFLQSHVLFLHIEPRHAYWEDYLKYCVLDYFLQPHVLFLHAEPRHAYWEDFLKY